MKVQSIAMAAMLFAAPAFAQTTTPSTLPSTPPAATTAPAGDMKFYTHQPNEMRASKLIGTKVRNNANENIGDINELIVDKDAKVAAVVIGVGGFLGIGEREVALDFKSLNIKYDPNAMTDAGATTVTVNATKDSLKNAPAWTWKNPNQYERVDDGATQDHDVERHHTYRASGTPLPGLGDHTARQ